HPDILTFVPREELEEDAGELLVGMHGRSRRGADAEAWAVSHVEDRRSRYPAPPPSEEMKKPGICRALSSCLVA
ncbi:hypothetical protein ABTM61_18960, partial [Acinetobacter baumannii]